MKVILSRKGFDGSNGGIPSPIFEDGSMLSMPIPSGDKVKYSDLSYNGDNYSKILKDLGYVESNGTHCHLDPDIDYKRRTAISGWNPAFGQIGSPAGYLDKLELQEGDLFLFFGNFHFVKKENGKYSYMKGTGSSYKDYEIQVIWGYLQIKEIIKEENTIKKYSWHPHSAQERLDSKNNTLYIPKDTLTFDSDMKGYGILPFSEQRVLTLTGCNKATWKFHPAYEPGNVVGDRKNSAKNKDEIYYQGIWQELGLRENKVSEDWAKEMLLANNY